VDSFVAPISLHASSLSKKLKLVVRGFFTAVDFAGACVILLVVMVPILVAMQVMRLKQWAEDYDEM
jgi:hypothetical protein